MVDSGAPVAEKFPSFADVAQDAGGAWPNGWYKAEVIAGYQAKGYTFSTEDTLAQKGDSRNLRLALVVDGGALGNRQTFYSLNYKPEELTVANYERMKAKDVSLDTRTRISLGKVGQLEKAFGFGLSRHPGNGGILAAPFVGQKVDVRLTTGETGYNEVNGLAAYGSHTQPKK